MKSAKILKMYPGAFNPLKKLKTVDLSYNSFASVPPELFTENPKLQNLSLSNNPLTMQPLDLPILISSSLQYLNLKKCTLSDLSTTSLSQVPNVRFLDLSGNRFTVLSADTLIPLSHLVYIDIRENQWICSADSNYWYV
jgi:Leucine-rich repeat (LRR) protein